MGALSPIVYTIGALGSGETVLFNDRTVDIAGCLYMLEEPPGWAGPSLRRSELPLALRDGQRQVAGYYGTRDMTLNGQIEAATRNAVRAGWEKLVRVTDQIRAAACIFSAAETVLKLVDCQLDGERLRNWEQDFAILNFSIPMVATDPLKYAYTASTETLVPGTAETLVNAGDKDTFPYLTISANGGTTITDVSVLNLTTGVTSQFVTSIPSGQALYADMRTLYRGSANAKISVGTSYDAGANRTSSWVAPREAFYLAPGNNSVRLTVNAGTNAAHRLDVVWRSAWS